MRIYFICAMVAIVFCAYLCGGIVAREKCNAANAHNQVENVLKIEDIKRTTNEKVIHTNGDDIRRILHEKYTVTE